VAWSLITSTEDAKSPGAFAAASAVERVGDSTYLAHLDEGFTVMGRPNGGYLLAVIARAATDHLVATGVSHPHCLAASASFIRAMECGPAQIEVEVHRSGTRISHVSAHISQAGRVAVDALLSCGKLGADAKVHLDAAAPTLPPVEACDRVPSAGPTIKGVSIMDRVELRLDAATTGFARGEISDDAEIRGWLRLADGEPLDPIALLFASDALPPATLPIGSSGWVPTIQLSAYVRGIPAAGWLIVRQRARKVSGGLVDEVCEIWDADGGVVAQAVQLAMVRFGS
jgi:acyl-CoA thioesterase